MPLTRFQLSAIADGGIATADLADGAITTAKIADSAVTSVKTSNLFTNTEIAGTEAARMPVGTTAQRANAQSGDIRFNSTLELMEYYTGTIWKAIDSPPSVTGISPTSFTASGTTITVTGTNFQTGLSIKVIGANGTEYTPTSVTRVSSTEATFDTTQAILDTESDLFDIKLSNTSGLSATLENSLEIANGTFAFTNAATSTIYDIGRSTGFAAGGSLTGGGGESDVTVSYAVTSGTLPSGGSISSSTGLITGISAVGSDTNSSFTVTATVADASAGNSTFTRAFTLTVAAPIITSYTSTGSGTFSVPSGLTAVNALVVAGGGAGGSANSATGTDGGGGGGAGGLIYRPAFPVTPGGSVSYTVGAGTSRPQTYGVATSDKQANLSVYNGQDSVFGTLTAKGGGAAGDGPAPNGTALAGGSGGGAGSGGGSSPSPNAGAATQPQQPGDSGTYGFGNPGGSNGYTSPYNGSGGGGAGAAGSPAGNGQGPVGGNGGIGKQYAISGSQVYYAGGGAGAGGGSGAGAAGSAGQGGGGTAHPSVDSAPLSGNPGSANRGGGGGGGAGLDTPSRPWTAGYGGNGGSGIVIVQY